MRIVGKKSVAKLLKEAKIKHDEVCRALANDRTVLERLDEILISIRNKIKQEETLGEIVSQETEKAKEERDFAISEKDKKVGELKLLSQQLNDLYLFIDGLKREKEIIEKELKETEDNFRRDFEESKVVLDTNLKQTKKDINDSVAELANLIRVKKDTEEKIEVVKDDLSELGMDIKKDQHFVNNLAKIKKEYFDILSRKYFAEREAKIVEQKVLQERLKLKELRRNKSGQNF